MDEILDLPDSADPDFEYAGFWIRFLAYLIDIILLTGVQYLLTYIVYGDAEFGDSDTLLTVIEVLVGIGYFTAMESSNRQATLGKMAVGIKVGDIRGHQLSFANALGRYLGKVVSAVILLIGFMMAGWDPKKQALHDKLADTYVFYGR